MKKKFLGTVLVVLLGIGVCGCQNEKADEPSMESTIVEQEIEEKVSEEELDGEKQQGGIRVEAEVEEITEETNEGEEQTPDYMGDMDEPWASEYVDDVDLNYVENLSDEEDGVISTQLNVEEDYGYVEEKDFSFVNELDETVYYYEMELFHFDEGSVPQPVITYLEEYYAQKEADYKKYGEEEMDAEWQYRLEMENSGLETEEMSRGAGIYDKLYFQYIPYIGEDYVSIVYYEMYCMGGAEYGTLEAITIDCKTGEEVTAAQVLGITNDAELRCEISDKMGVESILTWDELDYYITDKVVVFFGKTYWMQGNYDDVIVYR